MFHKKLYTITSALLLSLSACTSQTTVTQPDNIIQSSMNKQVLNTNIPKMDIKVNNSQIDEEILISPYIHGNSATGNLLVLDKSGNVLKSKKTQAEALNFEKWIINGQTRYSYIEHDPNAHFIINTSSSIPGSVVLLDENLNEIKRMRLLPNKDRDDNSPSEIDAHDFILINDNHYIMMSYYPKTVSNIPEQLSPDKTGSVIAAVIQEVENDKVVFEWDSSEHPELYANSIEGNDYSNKSVQNDYVHINSMIIDPKDDNLICSFRNLSQIIKIDRQTGNIVWKLGGKDSDFPLTDDQKFYFQHNATLVDDNKTLLFLDNGSSTARPYTRVLEFQLNESNKTIDSFKAFNAPENTFSQYMGSVQKKGDYYFIGWGSVPRVSEINYKTGEIMFDMNLEMNSYRAFKY